jgi:hypothetical protein
MPRTAGRCQSFPPVKSNSRRKKMVQWALSSRAAKKKVSEA